MNRQTQAYLYAMGAVLLWATVASAFKVALRYLDVPQMLFIAVLVSTVALFIAAAWQGKVKRTFACTRTQYLRSAALGFLNPFLYYSVLFEAYDRLPAQEAQPLNYTWPIVLVILSAPLLRQPIGRISAVAIAVSFLGVLVITTRGNPFSFEFADPFGAALAVGSAFIWAGFWLANVRDKRDPVEKLLLAFVFGLVFISTFLFWSGGLETADLRGVGAAAYAGIFEMGITFLLWMRALSLSRTTAQVGNLVFLSPFLSLALIAVIVGEAILPSSVIGLLFIIGGIAIRRFDRTVPRET